MQERSFLVLIEMRLRALEKSGVFNKIHMYGLQEAESRARRPAPLGLTRAEETLIHHYVPRVELDADVMDSEGHVLFYKHSCVNALEALPRYAPHWLFFDADDEVQRRWVRHMLKQKAHVKLILTGGDVGEVEDDLHHEVFFDQAGRISKKLQIEHVPAEVFRNGHVLFIREVAV